MRAVRRAAGALLAAVAATALLAACGAGGGSSSGGAGEGGGAGAGAVGAPAAASATPGADLGLSADLVEQRRDVERGAVQVELSLAAGAVPVAVAAGHLVSPAFPDAGPAASTDLAPGDRVDLPVLLGAPACGPAGRPAAEHLPATALLELAGGGTAEVALPDAAGHLARAHARACTAQRVADAVPLAWDPVWTTTGSGGELLARGVLHVGPVAAGHDVVLLGTGTTPLFAYAPEDPAVLPLRLAAGQAADLPVLLRPARCDAHAVADDKQGFAPPVSVAVDGAPPVDAVVWVPRSERSVATGVVRTRCGLG